MKILYSGGGTLGPVTPLIAIHDALKREEDYKAVWIGTQDGPEDKLVRGVGIRFYTIPSGKLRRYFSLKNISDLNRIFNGFFHSFIILWRENPDVCVSTGGFVSVPVHLAAWFLGIPTWIHQQDVRVGLANKLMAPMAKQITTVMRESVASFPRRKTVQLGNPIRESVMAGSTEEARKLFGIANDLPVVLAVGGGTGAEAINVRVDEAISHLDGVANMIHVTGRTRDQSRAKRASELFATYHAFPLLTDELPHAYALADVIVCRGGFGTMTELAALHKAMIVIPKAGHQQDNVGVVGQRKAGILLDEQLSNGYHLATNIKQLLHDEINRRSLGDRLHALFPPADPAVVRKIAHSLVAKK